MPDTGGARKGFEDLLEHLQTWGATVLITYRKSVRTPLGEDTSIQLGALSPEAGLDLLTKLAGRAATWGHGEAAELVDICGCNALAIKILAGDQFGQPGPSATVKRVLSELLPLAVVHELPGARYVMHPLVREIAADMLYARGPAERVCAYKAFAAFLMGRVKQLVSMGLTPAAREPAEALIAEELNKFRGLACNVRELIREGVLALDDLLGLCIAAHLLAERARVEDAEAMPREALAFMEVA
ncbi:hypothetical protein WJX81_003540 [Elliptochloris bilobata]|uniref:Uncharacterized protein n=1 Tax=Elliptochloris bilobata TaxID=381761 RepID=A0AAW1S4J3_9CHLO